MPIHNLMEDAATAEISRSQVWQWIHNEKGVLDDGRKIDVPLFRQFLAEEMDEIKQELGTGYDAGRSTRRRPASSTRSRPPTSWWIS